MSVDPGQQTTGRIPPTAGEVANIRAGVFERATVTEEELIEFCARRMAGYKKPKSVDFVDELPKSAYGKVLKRELREQYLQRTP
jgi:long-chain acyl-CoA synthetase